MKTKNEIQDRVAVPGALIIENTEREAEVLMRLCEDAFEMQTWIKSIVGDGASHVLRQFQDIRDAIPIGAVVFLDICLERDPKMHTGKDVARDIRALRPDLAILIYSRRADLSVCVELLAEEGLADWMIEKVPIESRRLSTLAFNAAVQKAIRRNSARGWSEMKVFPRTRSDVTRPDDWLVLELLSRVGCDEVARLIRRCIGGATTARLEYMSPGFSGAAVVRALVERANERAVDVVLKLSRDRPALETDRRHINDLGAIGPGHLLPHLRQEGIGAGSEGWFAYAMERVPGKPLARLLDTGRGATFLKLVLDEMRDWYNSKEPTKSDPLASLILSDSERACVIAQLHEVNPLIKRYWPPGGMREEQVQRFLENGELPGKSQNLIVETLGELPGTLQHGDLHADNILIEEAAGGQIKLRLIDWARYGLHPLGADFARLESQLRLRVVGKADSSAYDIQRIAEWQASDGLLHCDMGTLDSDTSIAN
jgi:Phosphotransferase enzyme family